MVRMLKRGKYENAKVFVRVMPMENMHWEHVKILEDKKTIYVRALQDFGKGCQHEEPNYWNFCTDGVHYNSSQEEIYNSVINETFLNDVIERNNNAIILGYGQTGTGKSVTITGLYCSYQQRGIGPRLIPQIFKVRESMDAGKKMSIYMSYIETKKYYAADLLNDNEDVLLDPFSIRNVVSVNVDNETDALKLLFKAEGRRDVNENGAYNSNTANGVLTFKIVIDDARHGRKISKIHIVDLAGADTIGNISCFFKNMTEIGQANLAKTQLEQFLLILCENVYERIVVKQRLNILITYLKDALNTRSLLRFIGHIRTNFENLKVTLSVLRFSQIILGLKFAKKLPKIIESDAIRESIPAQVFATLEKIKTDRIIEEMFHGPEINLNTNVDQERANHVRNVAEDYLKDKINVVVPLNVTDVNILLDVVKGMYRKLEEEKDEINRALIATTKPLEQMPSKGKLRADSLRKAPSVNSKRGPSKQSVGNNKLKRNSEAPTSGLVPNEKEKLSSVTSVSKIQSSTRSFKRGSMDRKKSAVSSDCGIKEVSSTQEESVEEIPPQVPTYENAWTMFIINVTYQYEALIAKIQSEEEHVKEVHKDYGVEVSRFQEVKSLFNLRKEALFKVKLRQDLEHEIKEESFNDCNENYVLAEKALIEAKEVVLKMQTELRLALDGLQRAKLELNQEFERFCLDKYKMRLPNLKLENITIPEELSLTECNEDNKPSVAYAEDVKIMKIYTTLQELMKIETAERKLRQKQHKWMNTIKI